MQALTHMYTALAQLRTASLGLNLSDNAVYALCNKYRV